MAPDSTSFIGSIPELYDRHLGPVFFDPYAADLAARIDPGALPLLDLASGTGRLTGPLLKRVGAANATVVALDLNPAMQQIAKRRVTDRRARVVTGNAMALPCANGTFAQAVCQFGFMFFGDKVRAAAEVRRVLRPNGVFLFNLWSSIAENPLAEIAVRVVGQFFTSAPPTFYHVPFGYFDHDRIRTDLRGGGFHSIEIATVDLPGQCESAAHIATGLVKGSPIAAEIAERATAPADAITKAVAAELERVFGAGSFQVPMRALVVRAA